MRLFALLYIWTMLLFSYGVLGQDLDEANDDNDDRRMAQRIVGNYVVRYDFDYGRVSIMGFGWSTSVHLQTVNSEHVQLVQFLVNNDTQLKRRVCKQ